MSQRLILIAEDDDAIRQVLADSLVVAGYRVLEASDGRQALEHLLTKEIDLALLDINMPEVNGFKLLKIIAKECPGTPSIVLTAMGEEEQRIKGLNLGADDYVSKPFSIAELHARISAVLRRYPARQVSVTQGLCFTGGQLDTIQSLVILEGGVSIKLTEKEMELFRYFLLHPTRIIPQEELLLRIWGSSSSAKETRAVAVTLTRLKEKLGSPLASYFENVRGRGYRWNVPS